MSMDIYTYIILSLYLLLMKLLHVLVEMLLLQLFNKNSLLVWIIWILLLCVHFKLTKRLLVQYILKYE